jgi:hypothetical protein
VCTAFNAHALMYTIDTHDTKHAQHLAAGFVEEMRIVAMKLHTKDQAPKEGEQKAAEKPFPKVGCTSGSLLSRQLPARCCAAAHFMLPCRTSHSLVQAV